MSSESNEGGFKDSGGGLPEVPPAPPPPASSNDDAAEGHAEPTTEPKAVFAVVTALVGIVLAPVILGPIALLLATFAQRKVRESEGTLTGYRKVPVFGRVDLIKTAWILGILDVLFGIVILAFAT